MEILKNKKIVIGGLVILALVGYFLMNKNKKDKETNLSNSNNVDNNPTTTIADNTPVTLGAIDPTGAVFLVLGGKKYAFVSEKAFANYGYSVPKQITKSQLDLIQDGGFVGDDGKIVKSS